MGKVGISEPGSPFVYSDIPVVVGLEDWFSAEIDQATLGAYGNRNWLIILKL